MASPNPHLLVFTDLDSTLLGHTDYRFAEALPTIKALAQRGIEIIPATSKTYTEVTHWRARLGLDGPFIVENGSAAYFPADQFSAADFAGQSVARHGDYFCTIFGTRIEVLNALLAPFGNHVVNFTRCPLDQAMAMTGLPQADAVAARTRSFSLPLKVEDAAVRDELIAAAAAANLKCLQGGRFLHLQGQCDKGDALLMTRDLLNAKSGQSHHTIALGDNQNDERMLMQADTAILVHSDTDYQFPGTPPHLIKTRAAAPAGWAEGIDTALKQIGAD